MELFSEKTIPERTWSETVSQPSNTIVNPRLVGGSFVGQGYGFNVLGNGDCEIGDYDNNNGMLWDNSARALRVKGDIVVTGDVTSSNYTTSAPYLGYKLEYSTGVGYFNHIEIRGGSDSFFISDTLDTSAKKILKDFTFGSTDYSGAFKTGDITWNETTGAITGGSGGLFNKAGLIFAHNGIPTITLDGTTGEITSFALTAGTINGVTITGGTIQTASGTGERMVILGTDNSLTFYNSSNAIVTQLGGGDDVTYGLRINLNSSTVAGVRVVGSEENGIGYRFDYAGNNTTFGFRAEMTGATNDGTCANLIHNGSGGEAISITTTAGAKGIELYNSGNANSIYINHSHDSAIGIDYLYSGRQEALYITGDDTSTSKPLIYATSSPVDSSVSAIKFERNGTGGVMLISNSSATNNNYPFGIEINIASSGTAQEAAFKFSGSEYIAGATGVIGLTGVIKVVTSDGLGYIPVYSSYS